MGMGMRVGVRVGMGVGMGVRVRVGVRLGIGMRMAPGVGPGLGVEGRLALTQGQTQDFQHGAEYVIGLKRQPIGFDLKRDVPVAHVITGPGKKIRVRSLRHHQVFPGRADLNLKAALAYQPIPGPKHTAPGQKHRHLAAIVEPRAKAAALAQIPIRSEPGLGGRRSLPITLGAAANLDQGRAGVLGRHLRCLRVRRFGIRRVYSPAGSTIYPNRPSSGSPAQRPQPRPKQPERI